MFRLEFYIDYSTFSTELTFRGKKWDVPTKVIGPSPAYQLCQKPSYIMKSEAHKLSKKIFKSSFLTGIFISNSKSLQKFTSNHRPSQLSPVKCSKCFGNVS